MSAYLVSDVGGLGDFVQCGNGVMSTDSKPLRQLEPESRWTFLRRLHRTHAPTVDEDDGEGQLLLGGEHACCWRRGEVG